jgi:hypothetical protein
MDNDLDLGPSGLRVMALLSHSYLSLSLSLSLSHTHTFATVETCCCFRLESDPTAIAQRTNECMDCPLRRDVEIERGKESESENESGAISACFLPFA